MYDTILQAANLTENEISIYTLLLNKGELTASEIAQKTAIKRGNTYYLIDSLTEKALIEQTKKGTKTAFRVTHPQKLLEYVEQQKRALEEAQRTVHAALPSLVSDYNLTYHKPGILFLEGEKGLREALFDSLKSKEEILAFVDGRSVQEHAMELNREYVKQRIKLGIKKKIILTDTPESRTMIKEVDPSWTQIKFMDVKKYPFTLSVEIYNDTVSYLTVGKSTQLAVLVINPEIAQYQKSMFQYLWATLP